MIHVAAYCRVSTDLEDQSNSFQAQQRYFREAIARNPQWTLCEIYADEGISGTGTKKRRQFNRMMDDARQGKFSLLLTKEVSRFSRNILDTISYTRELRSLGVAVLFLTDGICTTDPDAELRLSIMASLAQEESRRTSTRVVWGQTRQMEQGVVFGRSLLGYRVKNGKLSIEPNGAETVRLIFHKYAVERSGTREIADYLTKHGYLTAHGSSHWHPGSIVKILKNEKYIGDLVQKKTYTPDYLTHEKRKNNGEIPMISIAHHHDPIISEALWQLAQARLQQNRKTNPSGHSDLHLLSGKILCGQCGAAFVSRCKKQSNGRSIRRWCCATVVRHGAAACDVGMLLRDDDAMLLLKTVLENLNMDQKRLRLKTTDLAMEAIGSGSSQAQQIQSEIQKLRRKKEAVLDSYFSVEISKTDALTLAEKYETQIKALRNRLQEAQTVLSRTEIEPHLDLESQSVCKTILQSITVYKDRHIDLRLNSLPQIFRFREKGRGV